MIRAYHSHAENPNAFFEEMERRPNEKNWSWLDRGLEKLIEANGDDEGQRALLVLLGGTNSASFRLRVAQSHLRHDLTPSHWSHVLLLDRRNTRTRLRNATTQEISLERFGEIFPPQTNGVQNGDLEPYQDPEKYPNIALVSLPVAESDMLANVSRFQCNRSGVDALGLMLGWFAFLWGVAGTGNPLHQAMGIPSAVFIETIAGAAGYELTPGLASRASCPEAIWQSLRWWHEFYHADHDEEAHRDHTPLGVYTKPHLLG